MEKRGYQKLIVWQKSYELAYKIYRVTKHFPKEELYGMVSQLRRAALSIPANLAEGCGRQGKAELRQFANIALGSSAEVFCLLDFAFKLGYLEQKEYEELQQLHEEVGRLLWKFYKSFSFIT